MTSYRIKFLESDNIYSRLWIVGMIAGILIGLKAKGVI